MKKKLNLDREWRFHLCGSEDTSGSALLTPFVRGNFGSAFGKVSRVLDDSDWRLLNLPHDYQSEADFDKTAPQNGGFRQIRNAVYRKTFRLPREYEEMSFLLCFEGISRNALVYFNGSLIARSFSPYLPIYIDLTDRVFYEEKVNTLAVFVDGVSTQGWWYEGAGIYRHVYLYVREQLHFKPDGLFLKPALIPGSENSWRLSCSAELENTDYDDTKAGLRLTLTDNGKVLAVVETERTVCPANGSSVIQTAVTVEDPNRWDVDNPKLYSARVELLCGDDAVDCETVRIGFRTFEPDVVCGFRLNGKPIKLLGTCNHQDHAGVGAAVPDSLHTYRIRLLKDMGTNAYRMSHNPPPRELLDACDELGMLVLDETRLFEAGREDIENLEALVRRDRNHPSVVMYSMGNEEPALFETNGRNVFRRMKAAVLRNDDTRPVTAALKGAFHSDDGCAPYLDCVGVNYDLPYGVQRYHDTHPNECVFGSETNSSVSTRGCYQTDAEQCRLACYEGNKIDRDGQLVRETCSFMRNSPWFGGAFFWTGFDYRGEPSPFGWPQNSSQFGMIDTCGFPKDGFYQCQACFKEEPVLKLVPHWNWKPGQTVRVMAMSNCEQVELFLNGRPLGIRHSDCCDSAEWQVEFEPGTLSAVGYRNGVPVISAENMTAGEPKRILIEPDRSNIANGGEDAVPVNLSVCDEFGRVCETADCSLNIEVLDDGILLGVGNGDPASLESDHQNSRRLFAGHAQAIVGAGLGAQSVRVRVSGEGLENAEFSFDITEVTPPDYLPSSPVTDQYISHFMLLKKTFSEMPSYSELSAYTAESDFDPINIVMWFIEPSFTNGICVLKTEFELFPDEPEESVLYFFRICAKRVRVLLNGRVIHDAEHGDRPLTLRIPKLVGASAELYVLLEAFEGVPNGLQISPVRMR